MAQNTQNQGANAGGQRSQEARTGDGGRTGEQQGRAMTTRATPGGMIPGGALSPFGVMRRMMEDMDRLFADFGGGAGISGLPQLREMAGAGTMASWNPRLEVFDRGSELVVRCDLPGVKKEDVNVDIEDGMLTVEGERRIEKKDEREGVYHSEVSYGSFRRTIPLPEGASVDSAKASFRDGVLEVTMKNDKQARRGRRLEIGEGSGGTRH